MAVHKFLGNSIIKRLEGLNSGKDEDIRKYLCPDTEQGKGEWVDLGGLIAPKQIIEQLIAEIEAGTITTEKQISAIFEELHQNYYQLEWTWAWEVIQQQYKVSLLTITAKEVMDIVNTWKRSVVELDQLLYEDAQKEFSLAMQTGFGADGDHQQKMMDFGKVRGDFESNPFVETVKKHIKEKTALGDELLQRLSMV